MQSNRSGNGSNKSSFYLPALLKSLQLPMQSFAFLECDSLNFEGTMLTFDECITSVVIHFHFILMHSSDCSCINPDERLQSCAIISS